MPGGEFIPNDSMHWQVMHQATRPLGGPKAPRSALGRLPAGKNDQGRDVDDVMEIRTGQPHCIGGVDPVDKRDMPLLKVMLRFKDATMAREALTRALDSLQNKPGTTVVLEIPADPVSAPEADRPYPNPNAQVRVEW